MLKMSKATKNIICNSEALNSNFYEAGQSYKKL